MATSQLAQLVVDIVARNKTGPGLAAAQSDMARLMSQAWAATHGPTSSMMQKMASGQNSFMGMQSYGSGFTGVATPISAMMQRMASASPRFMGMPAHSNYSHLGLSGEQQVGAGPGSMAVGRDFAALQDRTQKTQKSITDEAFRFRDALHQSLGITGMSADRMQLLNLATRGAKQSQLDILGSLVKQKENYAAIGGLVDALGIRVRNITFAFAIGGGLLGGLIGAASPATLSTFTASIQELAGAIGTSFTPMIIELSHKLQRAADWFMTLSDSTRHGIGTFVAWTATIAGLTVVFVGFVRLLGWAWTTIKLIPPALAAVSSWTMITVGATTAHTSASAANAIALLGQASAANITTAAMARLAAAQNSWLMIAGRAVPIIALLAASQMAENDAATSGRPHFSTPGAEGPWTTGGGANRAWLRSLGFNFIPNVGDWLAGASSRPEDDPSNRPRPLRTHIPFQSQMMGIEQAWQRVQLGAISQTPHEQHMAQLQQQQLDQLLIIAGNTAQPGNIPINEVNAGGNAP